MNLLTSLYVEVLWKSGPRGGGALGNASAINGAICATAGYAGADCPSILTEAADELVRCLFRAARAPLVDAAAVCRHTRGV
eukprot:2295210-Prymnesium_polylepis.1